MDLGLADKSPYSTAANPNLHLFIHIVGCCLAKPRSINAKLVGKPDLLNVLTNALVFVYALRSRTKIEDPVDGEAQTNNEPKDQDADEWCEWIINLDYQIPHEIMLKLSSKWKGFKQIRSGTIGEYLRNEAYVQQHD
ncbi:unnamed protein product [Diamesa serratosioi]